MEDDLIITPGANSPPEGPTGPVRDPRLLELEKEYPESLSYEEQALLAGDDLLKYAAAMSRYLDQDNPVTVGEVVENDADDDTESYKFIGVCNVGLSIGKTELDILATKHPAYFIQLVGMLSLEEDVAHRVKTIVEPNSNLPSQVPDFTHATIVLRTNEFCIRLNNLDRYGVGETMKRGGLNMSMFAVFISRDVLAQDPTKLVGYPEDHWKTLQGAVETEMGRVESALMEE